MQRRSDQRKHSLTLLACAFSVPLKIAAKVDKVDEPYFQEVIIPLLNQPGVDGPIEPSERSASRCGINIAAQVPT
jgi:hypothetical protein